MSANEPGRSGAERQVGLRVSDDALHGVRRGPSFEIVVDGVPMQAYEGETIATVLLAHGQVVLRATPKRGRPRGLFCGMGVCFDCLVTVDGLPNLRSCVTYARAGMRVQIAAPREPGANGAAG
jgi:predicted molibdopterin-dependent oxidoreductase YjgC